MAARSLRTAKPVLAHTTWKPLRHSWAEYAGSLLLSRLGPGLCRGDSAGLTCSLEGFAQFHTACEARRQGSAECISCTHGVDRINPRRNRRRQTRSTLKCNRASGPFGDYQRATELLKLFRQERVFGFVHYDDVRSLNYSLID